jgi:hypothetical protein
MNEIMPYYNQVYATIALNNDPLRTMDLNAVSTGTAGQTTNGTDTNNTTNSNSSASRVVNSDTPQTMLSGDEDYATSATDSNGASNGTADSTNTSTGTMTGNTSGDTHTTGFVGLASDLIIRYRDSLINIDLTIITILGECFMQVWDSGDSLTY